jgi:membrane associated rhomboid family serine protease
VIPLRDINPSRSRPVATYLLIAINLAVFAFQLTLGPDELRLFFARFALVPALLQERHYTTLFTSMFMHGGLLHIALNLWTLVVFGDNVEDRLGKLRYVLFYVASGVFAALAQYMVSRHSHVPMVGASGAIAGVLAAYLRLFPRARVVTLIPVVIFFFVRELPAGFFIMFWFLLQLIAGFGTVAGASDGGVAVFAHIGGFVAGLWLVRALLPRRNPTAGFRPLSRTHG